MPRKRKDLKLEGSNLWYLVGLITSDGCLSKDGRHIDITSKDRDFLQTIKECVGFINHIGTLVSKLDHEYQRQSNFEIPKLSYPRRRVSRLFCHRGFPTKDFGNDTVTANLDSNDIGIKNKNTYKQAYRIQIANRNFYDFLLSIGLTQSKSLTLKEINVPNQYFVDFLRGMIDGDGCIRRWIHPSNKREQWSVRIYSGSKNFIEWLKDKTEFLVKIKGKIYRQSDTQWILKYGKMAVREISRKCYYRDCLGLDRKIKLAQECFNSNSGWSKSKTVFN